MSAFRTGQDGLKLHDRIPGSRLAYRKLRQECDLGSISAKMLSQIVAAAMVLSSVSVVGNALRLRMVKL